MMTKNNDRRKNYAQMGFTLLELLMGLYIVSVIGLCIYSTFSSGFHLNVRSQKNNSLYREASLVTGLMERELVNAVDYDFSDAEASYSSFTGLSDRVTFFVASAEGLRAVSYYLMQPEHGAIHKVVMGVTQQGNQDMDVHFDDQEISLLQLIREEKSFAAFINGPEDIGTREILSTQVAPGGLRFTYGHTTKDKVGETVWNKNLLPRMIKVELDFMPDGAARGIKVERCFYIPSAMQDKEAQVS